MSTVLVVLLAVYAAAMTILRVVAPKTETKVDDKLLAAGEAVEPVIDLLKTKVEAPKTETK
jgi:hypothetical protein